jgi:phospholipid/cholesterol/gamma-HCH transport system substrate-binding protein
MTEPRQNLIVGFTTLGALIGLAVLLLLFGYVPQMLKSGYYVTLELPDASSLNPGSRVELAGIDIGEVESIQFQQPATRGVAVLMRIRDEVEIPQSATPQVDKPLLGGSPTIKFNIKIDGQPVDHLPKDDSAVVSGKLGALAGAFGELERVTESFENLSTQWQAVGQKLDTMLEPRDLAAVEAGDQPGNLTTVVARFDRRLTEFREVLAGIDGVVNDPQLRKDLAATTANAARATGELSQTMATLEQKYAGLADEVAQAIGQMNKLFESAGDERGTVGKLLADPSLYNGLEDATRRIGAAADELQLLIQKWKDEGVPVKL